MWWRTASGSSLMWSVVPRCASTTSFWIVKSFLFFADLVSIEMIFFLVGGDWLWPVAFY